MAEETKIIEQNNFFFDELIALIKGNTVIPVIGYELLNSSAKGNVSENSVLDIGLAEDPRKDLLTKLLETYDKVLCENVAVKRKADGILITNGYDLLNSVYHELDRQKRKTFLVKLHDKIDNIRTHIEPIPSPFELLAKIKHFKFYINATIFNNMEFAVNVYKAPKIVKDIPDVNAGSESSYDIVNCRINSLEEMKIESYDKDSHLASPTKFSTAFFKKPCILNLFGTHSISSRDYIILDTDMIELITGLFESKQKYGDLKFILKDADLLFIGCDFPDWFLRFFIRFCVGGRLDKERLSSSYIFEKLNENQEYSRTFFISSYGMHFINMNPSEFVTELYKRLYESSRDESIEKDFYNNSVFISYNHDDKPVADKIVEQLKTKFVDVWYDRDGGLRQGDVLDPKIKSAIDNSCAFIPIISNKVNDNIDKPKYYKKEWNYAVQNKKPAEIFPVRTADFVNHTLITPGAFSQETITLLLMNSGFLFELVDPNDVKLREKEFLNVIKELQLKSRSKSYKD